MIFFLQIFVIICFIGIIIVLFDEKIDYFVSLPVGHHVLLFRLRSRARSRHGAPNVETD